MFCSSSGNIIIIVKILLKIKFSMSLFKINGKISMSKARCRILYGWKINQFHGFGGGFGKTVILKNKKNNKIFNIII